MSSTTKPHRSIFTSLSSSRSSASSSAASRSSTPLGCRDFRLRYAKDSKGHDLSTSYPYTTPLSSSASSAHTSATSTDMIFPVSCRDSLRLRYAKDSKSHDFTSSYPAQFGSIDSEEEQALLAAGAATGYSTPSGCRDYKRVVNRYAKDGKGIDFQESYRY